MEKYLCLKEAAAHINVKPGTLKTWDRIGILVPAGRIPGGRRLYTAKQLEEFVAGRAAPVRARAVGGEK